MMYLRHRKAGNETTIQQTALRNLGVSSTEEINDWFRKSYAGNYRIDGIDEAIDLLESKRWDLVRVIGDYDVDGTTSTAQMRLVLRHLGYPVQDRIPRRFTEGFGLNRVIIEEIPALKNVLIITVDNGIAAAEAIDLAKSRGFHVIVIDHHLPAMKDGCAVLPRADVIIDPQAIEGSADFTQYCGSGLAWRFLCRLIDRRMASDGRSEAKVKQLKALKAILEPLAMMGTIADVVELREENYVIARNGLSKLDRGIATAGVRILHERQWVTHPTAMDIGFKSGPCINANGRLFDNGAAKSVDLLSCMNPAEAYKLAGDAIANNNIRKQQVDAGLLLAKRTIEAKGYENDLPMILYLEHVNEGILGIIAGRLQEKYGTVVCVFSDSEGTILKGSGRSTEDIHLKNLLDHFGEMFTKYGGHAGAAGMSIDKSRLEEFRVQANAYAREMGFEHERKDELSYDLEITADQVPECLDTVIQYGPFGQGNSPIMFKVTGFRLKDMDNPDQQNKIYVGKDGVKLISEDCQAIGFGMAPALRQSTAKVLTLYGTLSYNYFKGDAIPQIEFVDYEEKAAR